MSNAYDIAYQRSIEDPEGFWADAAQEIDLSEKDPERFAKMKAQMLKMHRDVMEEAFDWRSLK